MTVIASDNFTDSNGTLLQNHTPSGGGSWTKLIGGAGVDIEIYGNGATPSGDNSWYYHSATPSGVEYDVSYTLTQVGSSNHGLGCTARSSTSAQTGYLSWHGPVIYYLYKAIAGSFTELGSSSVDTPTAGDTVKLEIKGASKKLFVNGVERISSSNNDITDAGKAGFRTWGTDTASYLDNWQVEEVGGGSSVNLTLQDSVHAQTADNLSLSTSWLLTVADATHAHLADSPTLTTDSALTVAEAHHAQAADTLGLTADSLLAVNESAHAHAAENVVLDTSNSTPLAVQETAHAHSADNLDMTLDVLLAVADALHVHLSDEPTLSTDWLLAIADAAHAHAADAPTFTTDAWLAVADAVHGHLADGVVLTTAETLAILEAVHAHSADNLTLWFGASYFERIDLRSLITFALALQSPITRRVDLESPLQ